MWPAIEASASQCSASNRSLIGLQRFGLDVVAGEPSITSMANTTDKLTQVAFLRAINVGGHRVTNVELVQAISGLGFPSAVAYQASGNLLLSEFPDTATGTRSDIEEAIEQALEVVFGYSVPAMIRSSDEVRAIAEATPFPAEVLAATSGKIQVMIFKNALTREQKQAIVATATPDDRIVVDGSEVYWLPTDSISTSEFKVGVLNRSFGPFTIRTHGTIVRIAKKLAD